MPTPPQYGPLAYIEVVAEQPFLHRMALITKRKHQQQVRQLL